MVRVGAGRLPRTPQTKEGYDLGPQHWAFNPTQLQSVILGSNYRKVGRKKEGEKENREKEKHIFILTVRLTKQTKQQKPETQNQEPYRKVWQQFKSVPLKAKAS